MAEVEDITIVQNETYMQDFMWKDGDGRPLSLVGYTAKMAVRSTLSSNTSLLDLTTANGRISLSGSTGIITLSLTAADTLALTWAPQQGATTASAVYDLFIVDSSGQAIKFMKGTVTLELSVTRT